MLLTAGFIGVLTYVQKQRDSYYAEKDAVYRHYIELHPEDFPIPGVLVYIFKSFKKWLFIQKACHHTF